MMNRRGLLGGAVGAAALMVSACVPWSRQSRVRRAAESVDGVEFADLGIGPGGTFAPQISGEIHCSVGEDELEGVFDAAWRDVVTILHAADDGRRQVIGVSAISRDDAILTPSGWLPRDERGHVTVADFFERYGLG